jgi:protein SCO1
VTGRLGLVLVGLAAAALGVGCRGVTHVATAKGPVKGTSFEGTAVLPGAAAADFRLRDQDGKLVSLEQQRGRAVLLTFLYTRCRDVCPIIAASLSQVLHELTARERSSVRVIAVSVDPAGDTPAAVKAFIRLHRLPSQFHYVSGTPTDLKRVWQAYNVLSIRRNAEVVDHSAPTLLIDERGRPRVYYDANVSTEAVVHDVRLLLRRSF